MAFQELEEKIRALELRRADMVAQLTALGALPGQVSTLGGQVSTVAGNLATLTGRFNTGTPRTFIRYRNAGGSAVTWPGTFTVQGGFLTTVKADTSAFTFNGTTFTCVRPGRYRFEAVLQGGGTTAAAWSASQWRKNGVGLITTHTSFGTSAYVSATPSEVFECVAGDTITLATVGSGVGLIAASTAASFLTVTGD